MITLKTNKDVFDVFVNFYPQDAVVLQQLFKKQNTKQKIEFLKDLLVHAINHLEEDRKNELAIQNSSFNYRY